MVRKKTSRTTGMPSTVAPLPPLPDRRLMEQQMRQIGQLLQSKDFASVEEANAFLQEMLAGGELNAAPPPPETPLEEAQEIVYQAMEVTGKRRVQLARKALATSPDCADAYVILAEETRDPKEAKPLYAQGVEAGERALGPEPFKHDVGHFWGLMETRPYMRARFGLAEVLWMLGERREAIGHAQDLLRLNPGDNQGVRYILANWLLIEGEDDALGALLKEYKDEPTASWAYTRAIWTFRRKGKSATADNALKRAFRINPFVPLYLVGARRMPRRMPDYIGIGDENEAVDYLAGSLDAWLETSGAMEWFMGVMERELQASASGAPRPFILP